MVPVKIGECESCPWGGYCRPQLELPPGDVSLLPRIGWSQWKIHHDHGVTNRAELAVLDPLTAHLVAAGVNVAGLLAAARGQAAGLPLAALDGAALSPRELELVLEVGLTTVGDVVRLSHKTAAYSDVALSTLPLQIDQARAALGTDPVYRRRGVEEIRVPRAAVEVDIDMENVEEGCYLWGCLLTMVQPAATQTTEEAA